MSAKCVKRQKTSPTFPSIDDGDGDEDATINAGAGLMMSFMGQQDKAEQGDDLHQVVPEVLEPSGFYWCAR
ncbi:MAG: hypothetical protein V5A66_01135 [Candidatus Thermoplasmatota archaeon]